MKTPSGWFAGGTRIHDSIALIWGFAEATLFFLVPDIWITGMALQGMGAGLRSAVGAAVGAWMGGIFMYIWGARFPETALLVVERIPNISASMMHQVRDQLLQQGYSALWIGAFSGKPFKIYAIYAGLLHLSFPRFLWMGFWARLSRFALLGLLVGYSSRSLQRKISLRVKVTIWAIAWTLFYSWYFRAMPE